MLDKNTRTWPWLHDPWAGKHLITIPTYGEQKLDYLSAEWRKTTLSSIKKTIEFELTVIFFFQIVKRDAEQRVKYLAITGWGLWSC
jgi:hypothetical protein